MKMNVQKGFLAITKNANIGMKLMKAIVMERFTVNQPFVIAKNIVRKRKGNEDVIKRDKGKA
jgi:hypothetical protein